MSSHLHKGDCYVHHQGMDEKKYEMKQKKINKCGNISSRDETASAVAESRWSHRGGEGRGVRFRPACVRFLPC